MGAYRITAVVCSTRKRLGSELTGCGDIPDQTFGVTDAATIDHAHNRIYVVDGTGLLWAFDLATGNVSPGWPPNVEAFSAASGAPLWNSGSSIASGMESGPTIVNGRVYVVDWSDTLYAFGT